MGDNPDGLRSPGSQRQSILSFYTVGLIAKPWVSPAVVIFIFAILMMVGALIFRMDVFVIMGGPNQGTTLGTRPLERDTTKIQYRLNCSQTGNITQTTPTKSQPYDQPPTVCPDYFRWLHLDLEPWRGAGITRETFERAKTLANFRLVVVQGRPYVERYVNAFQTRDVFTLWGILQLLRLYPAEVPDLELFFWCGDHPVIQKHDYQGDKATWPPPPMFHYCGNKDAVVIIFPDWSFWGWPEIDIKPWESTLEAIKEGNTRIKWNDRVTYAFWKGNPDVSSSRHDLMKCNSSSEYDPGVHLYVQDWLKEKEQGYRHSRLEDQCTHRYKIYIEGVTWSVSEKYVLACDSMTLVVKPQYYDFFTRAMVPMEHYWPIRPEDKCRSLKFAVEWGNKHTGKAEDIGKRGAAFVEDNLRMAFVYDYMLHLLRGYAELMKFKPEIPPGAEELSVEKLACPMDGLVRKFMEDSMTASPSDRPPCEVPPPYIANELEAIEKRKRDIESQVESWEKTYWKKRQ